MLAILPGIHFDPRMCPAAQPGHFGVRVDPPPPTIGYRRAMDTYQIYDGIDENGIVGTLAPGLFAQEGRCWRMVYEIPVGHGTHCMDLGVGRGVEVPRRLDEGGVTSSMLTS